MSCPRAKDESAVRFVPPEPPKTPKSAGTRRRVLDVAAALFIERGYEAVSMRDIAAAAELSKGAIYGHFRSKGQLLVEAIRWKLAEREHSPDFAQQMADYQNAVRLMYDESGREIHLLEVDAAAAARHDPDVETGLAELYQQRQERMRAGISGVPDPEMAAWLISVISAGIAMKQALELPFPDPERLHSTLLTALLSLT